MKKRRLNLAWLSGVMFGTLFFLIICYGVRHFQIKKNSKIFLRLADEAEVKKDAIKLEEYLKRYIRLNPKDPNGLVRYVVHQSERGRWEYASRQTKLAIYQKLIQATEFVPERKDVWERLVRLGISVGRYKDTLLAIKSHLLKESPDNPEYLEYLATCHYELGALQDADQCLRKAREAAPDRLQIYVFLAILAEKMKTQNIEPAQDPESIMNEMVANNPQDPGAYFRRANWRWNQYSVLDRKRSQGQVVSNESLEDLKNSVKKDYEQALELGPDNASILIQYADFSKKFGKTQEARDLLQRGLKASKNDVIFSRELARIEHDSGNPQLGLKMLYEIVKNQEAELKTIPKGSTNASALMLPDLKLLLAEWAINRSDDELVNNDYVENLIAELKSSKKFSPSRISYLEAHFDATKNQWTDVVSKLEKIRIFLLQDTEKLIRLDYLLGVAYTQLQSPEQALRCFQNCLVANSNFDLARRNLAQTLRSLNRLPEAIVELRKMTNKPGSNRSDQALLAEFLLQSNASNPPNQRTWGEFDKVLRTIENEDLESLPAAVLRLQQLNAENRNDEYERLLKATRAKHPDNVLLSEMEFRFAIVQKNWPAAEEMIAVQQQESGDTVGLRAHQGLLIVNRETPENAKKLLEPLSVPFPQWSSPQRAALLAQFSDFYLQIQAYDEADECLNQAKTALPENGGFILRQIQISVIVDKLDRAAELLDDYRNLVGENATWYFESAKLIYAESLQGDRRKLPIDQERFTAAIRYLKSANQQRPNWDELHCLWGDVLNRHGDVKESLDEYIAALTAGSRQSIVATKAVDLLMNYFMLYEDADNLLRRLKSGGFPFNNQLLHEEINVAVILGRNKQALDLLQGLPEETLPTSGGPQYLNPAWRGEKYLTLREYEKAEAEYQRSIAQNPAEPRVLPSLVAALVGQGKSERAEEVLEEAQKSMNLEKHPTIMGFCYEYLGKSNLAEASYRSAANSLPPDFNKKFDLVAYLRRRYQLDDAETMLRTIEVELKSETDDAVVLKNRIRVLLSLADILYTARQRLPESLDLTNQSLALIDASGSRSNFDRETPLRLKTRILEELGNRNENEEAISILEKLDFKPPITETKLNDRKLLSKLYYRLGDSTRGRNVLIEAITKIRSETRFDTVHADLLREIVLQSLKIKEDSTAKDYLTKLKQLAPEALNTKDTEVRVLEANNNLNEIRQILTEVIKKNPDEKRIYSWAAGLYELVADRRINDEKTRATAVEFYNEAERLYIHYAELVPEAFYLLSAFQLKIDHVDQGLELLSAHLEELQIQHLNLVTRNLMNNPRPEAKQKASRLSEIFAARLPTFKPQDQKGLESLMADFLAWSGSQANADAIHLKLVSDYGSDYVILNNYAFFLALSDGNLSTAQSLIDKAILLAGPLADLLDTRGYVMLAAGRSKNAVADFQAAVKTRESAERYFHLAVALSKSDPSKPKLALTAYERALELGLNERMPTHPREQTQLKQLLAFLKDARITSK
jgi:tetratricopeptide (TPR) repeat protein